VTCCVDRMGKQACNSVRPQQGSKCIYLVYGKVNLFNIKISVLVLNWSKFKNYVALILSLYCICSVVPWGTVFMLNGVL
jgi:hypothetical protein